MASWFPSYIVLGYGSSIAGNIKYRREKKNDVFTKFSGLREGRTHTREEEQVFSSVRQLPAAVKNT